MNGVLEERRRRIAKQLDAALGLVEDAGVTSIPAESFLLISPAASVARMAAAGLRVLEDRLSEEAR